VGSNFGVAAAAVSVGCVSLICASLIGERAAGVVTFSVDPSAEASSPAAAFELGDVGAGDCRLQANVSANAAAAAVMANLDRFMRRLLLRNV
jgi:hypothetical protein